MKFSKTNTKDIINQATILSKALPFMQRYSGKSITVKFGGSTSFDIYPNGWDKRYCLTHFADWETWFVGDRCEEGGNDQELYEHLFDEGRSFKTEDTNQTRLIIDEQIIPNLIESSE